MPNSPEFKFAAFKQDIDNLKTTLDRLEIVYTPQPIAVQIKQDNGELQGGQTIMMPTFNIQQFLGRLCMIIEDLQQFSTGGSNDMNMRPRCPFHELEGPFMFLDETPYCLSCIVDKSVGLNAGACGWVVDDTEG